MGHRWRESRVVNTAFAFCKSKGPDGVLFLVFLFRTSPLHLAISNEMPEFVDVLLKAGCQLNDNIGVVKSPALHLACVKGNLRIVQASFVLTFALPRSKGYGVQLEGMDPALLWRLKQLLQVPSSVSLWFWGATVAGTASWSHVRVVVVDPPPPEVSPTGQGSQPCGGGVLRVTWCGRLAFTLTKRTCCRCFSKMELIRTSERQRNGWRRDSTPRLLQCSRCCWRSAWTSTREADQEKPCFTQQSQKETSNLSFSCSTMVLTWTLLNWSTVTPRQIFYIPATNKLHCTSRPKRIILRSAKPWCNMAAAWTSCWTQKTAVIFCLEFWTPPTSFSARQSCSLLATGIGQSWWRTTNFLTSMARTNWMRFGAVWCFTRTIPFLWRLSAGFW